MMDRQLRRPAREAQRIRPAANPGFRGDARGGLDVRARGIDEPVQAAHELVGVMFTAMKELRHVAEQHFGELFVPTEVLEEGPLSTVVALRTESQGMLLVHAERERHWYPFRITGVERRSEGRPVNGRGDSPRPRLPYGFRVTNRPRIDWL